MKKNFLLASFLFSMCSLSSVTFAEKIKNAPNIFSDNCRTNWIPFPCNQKTYQHVREIMYSLPISRKGNPTFNLEESKQNIDNITFKSFKDGDKTIKDWIKSSYTDAFIVLKDGKIVKEYYSNGMNQNSTHNIFSVTKSFVGTIAVYLIQQHGINVKDKVVKYIPALKGSGFENFTIDDLLSMRSQIAFDEDYDNLSSDFYAYTCAATNSCIKMPKKNTVRKYLKSIKYLKPKIDAFNYTTPTADVLMWFDEAVSGKKFNELLTELVWSKIGAENDGYFIGDKDGVAYGGAGLNITLRDAARFGQMLLQKGNYNNQQILPASVIDQIEKGGDKDFFAKSPDVAEYLPGGSYKNEWWMQGNDHNAYMGIGIFGQWLYIDPTSKVVIVKFSALDKADTDDYGISAWHAMDSIAKSLK